MEEAGLRATEPWKLLWTTEAGTALSSILVHPQLGQLLPRDPYPVLKGDPNFNPQPVSGSGLANRLVLGISQLADQNRRADLPPAGVAGRTANPAEQLNTQVGLALTQLLL